MIWKGQNIKGGVWRISGLNIWKIRPKWQIHNCSDTIVMLRRWLSNRKSRKQIKGVWSVPHPSNLIALVMTTTAIVTYCLMTVCFTEYKCRVSEPDPGPRGSDQAIRHSLPWPTLSVRLLRKHCQPSAQFSQIKAYNITAINDKDWHLWTIHFSCFYF